MSIVSYVLVPRPVDWDALARDVARELDVDFVRTGDAVYDVKIADESMLMVQLETRESNGYLALELWPEWIRPRLVERPYCLSVQAVGDHDDGIAQLQAFIEHAARTLDGIVFVPEANILIDGSSEIERDTPPPSDDDDDEQDEDKPLDPSAITGLGVCVLEFRRQVTAAELAVCARDVASDLTEARRAGNWTRVALANREVWLDFQRMPKRGVPFYVRCEISNRSNRSVSPDESVAVARTILSHVLASLDIALIDFELGATSDIGDD